MLREPSKADPLLRRPRAGAWLRLRVIAEVTWTYVSVRRLLARHDIATVVNRLREDTDDHLDPATARLLARRLAHVSRRTLAVLPLDSRCLMSSLVLLRMMARRGARCELSIGAGTRAEFEAHAWLEHEGHAVLPTLGFAPLTVI